MFNPFRGLFQKTRPWQRAHIECREYANASCNKAMMEGLPAGVIICTLKDTSVRHAVVWIEFEGEIVLYDASFGKHRKFSDFADVHSVSVGLSHAPWNLMPMPTGTIDINDWVRQQKVML